jgi:hypothetical protein
MAPHDAAAMNAIFKAYDIRGTVPDQLDAALMERIGAAFARFAAHPAQAPTVEEFYQLDAQEQFGKYVAPDIAARLARYDIEQSLEA